MGASGKSPGGQGSGAVIPLGICSQNVPTRGRFSLETSVIAARSDELGWAYSWQLKLRASIAPNTDFVMVLIVVSLLFRFLVVFRFFGGWKCSLNSE